jgi:hypothetical protein
VAGTNINAEGAAETLALVRDRGGRMDSTRPLDLNDEDRVKAWIDATAAAYGGCILLIGSTAGLTGSLTNPRIAHTATKGDPLAEDHQMRTIARAIPLGRIGTPRMPPAASSSWPPTRPRTSPAPTWSSTAAGPPSCPAPARPH